MAIPFLNHLDLLDVSEIQNAILHKTTSAVATGVEGKIIYDTSTDSIKFYNGTAWLEVSTEVDANTTYDLAVPESTTKIRLTGSDSTTDDVEIAAGTNVTVTRTNANKITISSTNTNTNQLTTWDLIDDDNDSFTISHDKNVKFTAATGTAGTNITGTGTNADPYVVAITLPNTVYVHPDHSGHVTSSGDGATVLTVAAITGQTPLSSGLVSTDEFVINDGGVIKRMDVSVLETYMQNNLTFTENTNTGVDMTEATLRSKLALITENVTIGDGTDVQVTTSGNLVVTGDLVVSGDTITANVGTLDVEDKNITLNYHASNDTSSTADGAGITIQDAVNSTTDATILWNATNDKFDFSHSIDAPSVFLNGTQILASATELNQLENVTVGGTTAGDIVTINGTQTLTNKTISASQITEISNLTAGEGAQLENINSVTISNTQWGYLGALNQGLTTTSDVAFNSLDIEGDVDVNGTLEADAITVNGTALNTVIDGRITAREYKANFPSSATSAGDTITITHSLGTRDVIVQFYALVADIDGDANTPNVDQYEEVKLENTRATTNTITVAPNTGLVANALRVLIKEL